MATFAVMVFIGRLTAPLTQFLLVQYQLDFMYYIVAMYGYAVIQHTYFSERTKTTLLIQPQKGGAKEFHDEGRLV